MGVGHNRRFFLRPIHIQLLQRANIRWEDGEYGAPGIDSKRPYGNSDVEADILEILGASPEGDDGEESCWSSRQRAMAAELHKEMEDALRIILQLQTFKPGAYVETDRYAQNWIREEGATS